MTLFLVQVLVLMLHLDLYPNALYLPAMLCRVI